MEKPTDLEKMTSINQDKDPFVLIKSDKSFTVNNVKLHLYTNENLDNVYVSIKSYCLALGIKPDAKFFMRQLQYPDIIFGCNSDDTNVKLRNVFFININGCKEYIESKYHSKYKTIKKLIYKNFKDFIAVEQQIGIIQDTPYILQSEDLTNLVTQEKIQEFKMFDENEISHCKENNQEIDNIDSILDSVKVYIETLRNDIKRISEENKVLKQENDKFKVKVSCNVDSNQLNNLNMFFTECEKCTDNPFSNKYILDTLTTIIDKAIQEHISNGGSQFDFINGFNIGTNKTTLYKNQPKEYHNEPFVRIAMRLYGYEVLEFGLNSSHKEYILHQFKNMFGINITQNKFVLGVILGLLQRKVEPCLNGNQLKTNINFNIQQI